MGVIMNQGKRGDGCHHPGVGLGVASEEWVGVRRSGKEWGGGIVLWYYPDADG